MKLEEEVPLEEPALKSVYERKQAKLMTIILKQQKQLRDMMEKIKVIDNATSHIVPLIIQPEVERAPSGLVI
jgi:hypothetical protein